jgi:glycogen(starch) synthase
MRVLYFGCLEHRKGVLTLCEAVSRWLEAGPVGRVTFVGGDTKWRGEWMSARIRKTLGHLLESGSVELLPHLTRQELSGPLGRADLVVLPSLYENFPYACLEAMSCAKPVLATCGSGYDEILEDGTTGFLVPAGDAAALAVALVRLSGDLERLEAVGRSAQKAITKFFAPLVTEKLCRAYAAIGSPTADARNT